MFLKLALVGLGGSVGAILRYVMTKLVFRIPGAAEFPYGTLTVNLIGCFVIGLLSGLAESRQLFTPEARLVVFVGFLGSFTTFSTFEYELFTLARDGQFIASVASLSLQVVFGFMAVWLGFAVLRLV